MLKNYKRNKEWQLRLEKHLNVKTELDSLGFLRKEGLLNDVVDVPDTKHIADQRIYLSER